MKIYQVVEHYEERQIIFGRVLKTYLSKEKAETYRDEKDFWKEYGVFYEIIEYEIEDGE